MFDLKTKLSGVKTRAKDFLVTTALDQRGVAAVEFAFIAPLMLIFYFGMVEISLAVEADRNLSHAASLVGDLTAQDAVVTIDMIENYIYGAMAVLDIPADEADDIGLELYAFEVTTPDDPNTAVDERVIEETGYATYGNVIAGGVKFDPKTIKEEILTDTSGVVVARMTYDYTAKITSSFVKVGNKTFEETFMLKPRRSAVVRFDNENGNADPAQRYNITCTFDTVDDANTANCSPA